MSATRTIRSLTHSPSSSSLLLSLSCLFLLLLLCCPSVSASSLFDPKVVPQLDASSFEQLIHEPHTVSLITFCTARNSKCKELAPSFTGAVKSLQAQGVRVGWVDCKQQAELCEDQEVADRLPGLKLFVGGSDQPPTTYRGRVPKSKELLEWVWEHYPNHVTLLTKNLEKKKPRDVSKARLLLFTDKRVTTPLYKSLAFTLHSMGDHVVVTEVRKVEKSLFKRYEIGSQLPVLLLELPIVEGEEEKSPRRYEGKMDRELILNWIQSLVTIPSADDAAASASMEGVDEALAMSIPELQDQSCVEKHCNGLCFILFLSRDHPQLKRHLTTFATIRDTARSMKDVGRFNFVWSDILVSEPHQQFAEQNFEIAPTDFPQFVLATVRKERFANYIGAFATESIISFLKDVQKGRVKTGPFVTKDGKLMPLPNDTQHCAVEEKQAASESDPVPDLSTQPPPTPPPVEEGELHVISTATHSDLVESSIKPWLLLFHWGNSHLSTYPNLTTDFERVAKNMKNMVAFGLVNLENDEGMRERYELHQDQLPVIKSIAHGVEAKKDMAGNMGVYEGSLTAPKEIRSFAQGLLKSAKVMEVSSQSMTEFMGSFVPNMPFTPKFLLFAKPSATGEDGKPSVPIPDFVRALSLEFGPQGLTFGVASSRDRALARQLNVQRIPAVLSLQQEDVVMPGQEDQPNQLRVGATAFQGHLTYTELRGFCISVLQRYEMVKERWAAKAATAAPDQAQQKRRERRAKRKAAAAAHKAADEEEHVDLDAMREEL